jgi:hypothetical protein
MLTSNNAVLCIARTIIVLRISTLSCALIIGCGPSSGTPAGSGKATGPTAEQEHAWGTIRQEILANGNRQSTDPPYQVARFLTRRHQWQGYGSGGDNASPLDRLPSSWWNETDPSGRSVIQTGLERAQAVARQEAARSDVAATVVLDLFSQERPSVVCWYYYDGGSLASSSQAPRPDLQQSLNDYLEKLWTGAAN